MISILKKLMIGYCLTPYGKRVGMIRRVGMIPGLKRAGKVTGYANIMDIMTYDDLLHRLENIISMVNSVSC